MAAVPGEHDLARGVDLLDDPVDEPGVRVVLVAHQDPAAVGPQDRVVPVRVGEPDGLVLRQLVEPVVELHQLHAGAPGGRGGSRHGVVTVGRPLQVQAGLDAVVDVDRHPLAVDRGLEGRARLLRPSGQGQADVPRRDPGLAGDHPQLGELGGQVDQGVPLGAGRVGDEDRDLVALVQAGDGRGPVGLQLAVDQHRSVGVRGRRGDRDGPRRGGSRGDGVPLDVRGERGVHPDARSGHDQGVRRRRDRRARRRGRCEGRARQRERHHDRG